MEIYTAVLIVLGYFALRFVVPLAILLLLGRFLAQKTSCPMPS